MPIKKELLLKTKNKVAAKPAQVPPRKHIEYSVRINHHLFQRITRHLLLLKHIKSTESKQKWIQEAIEEKLLSVKNSGKFAEEKSMHLKIDVEIWDALQKEVEKLRLTRRSVSKKILIEEAILEKLEKEEHKSKELLKNLLNMAP